MILSRTVRLLDTYSNSRKSMSHIKFDGMSQKNPIECYFFGPFMSYTNSSSSTESQKNIELNDRCYIDEQLTETCSWQVRIWKDVGAHYNTDVAAKGSSTSQEHNARIKRDRKSARHGVAIEDKTMNDTRSCHTCGIVGHLSRACPMKTKWVVEWSLKKDIIKSWIQNLEYNTNTWTLSLAHRKPVCAITNTIHRQGVEALTHGLRAAL